MLPGMSMFTALRSERLALYRRPSKRRVDNEIGASFLKVFTGCVIGLAYGLVHCSPSHMPRPGVPAVICCQIADG